jgi:hypothetical protein
VKEKRVYKRDYKEKELDKYYELAKHIKNNFLEDKEYIDSETTRIRYSGFEGKSYIRIYLDKTSTNLYSGRCKKPVHKSRITIEKVGEDTESILGIEKLILEEGFEKEIKE